MTMPSSSISRYASMQWRGSTDPDNATGTAVFTVLTHERFEVPLPSFKHAHQLFERLTSIAEMAYEDGRASIKQQVSQL